MDEAKSFCIVKLHSGRKRICQTQEIFLAGNNNKYDILASVTVLKRAKNGTAQRIWNGEDRDIVTVLKNGNKCGELSSLLTRYYYFIFNCSHVHTFELLLTT